MSDRPILFSAPMVRALLAGTKTQTRRVVKLSGRYPDYIGPSGCMDDPSGWGWETDSGDYQLLQRDEGDDHRRDWRDWVGAYQVGDRLWVREAWRCNGWATDLATIFYRASEGDGYTAMTEQFPIQGKKHTRITSAWRPSIHMPRWASRLTLAVTDVRIEHLQDISEADAIAEGIVQHGRFFGLDGADWDDARTTASDAYLDLWYAINGPGSWEQNPWVVAISFDVHQANIDAMPARAVA